MTGIEIDEEMSGPVEKLEKNLRIQNTAIG